MAAIDIQNLKFSYAADSSQPVLDIPSWQLQAGQRCFLYGRSGSGKSTLLRLLCGLMPPQQGSIRLLGEDITQLKPARMDQFRARNIGLVSQQLHLLPYLSVAENIQLAPQLAGLSKAAVQASQEYMVRLLEQLHLGSHLLQQPAQQLSQGQQQRVAIARALINRPPLVLVDEPTSALDYQSADAFMHLLLETLEPDTTVLMISHDQRHAPLFDQAVSLQQLLAAGTDQSMTTREAE
ncbi:ABC transporter ATP-binding protein [Oceanobacter mangrovi]|uniref:ABC transporter ATP-binding protein n=1 Tax=Oceanobacter mangrovi TaxID=2862510 RepID=UPI001C8D1340|nr:ATP-binding cassette domain-containing protein [Oceanobacter mangrovi]